MKPAIVLATHTMGLGVIRALGKKGVPIVAVTYDKKDFGYCSRYVTCKICAPHPDKNEDQFISLLVKLAERFESSFLIPVSDETLVAVSRNKSLLERYYIVACAQWDIIERLIDKKHTYELAEAAGVPLPKIMFPESFEDVEQYSRYIEFPCLVKPRQSHLYFNHFGIKMVKVDSPVKLRAACREAIEQGFKVMLQEFIQGDDSQVVNYNSYFWNSQPLVEFTAQQIRKAPPALGSPCVVLSKRLPEIIENGRKLIRATGFYGFSCMEIKKDPRDGVYKLIEVNGRHNLSGMLAVHCGINFPWLHYQHLMEGKLPSAADWKEGIYWIDLVRDAAYVFDNYRRSPSLRRIILPYSCPHVFSELSLHDPLPFAKRMVYLFRRFFRKFLMHKTK